MVQRKDRKGPYTLIINNNVHPNVCSGYGTNRDGLDTDAVITIR